MDSKIVPHQVVDQRDASEVLGQPVEDHGTYRLFRTPRLRDVRTALALAQIITRHGHRLVKPPVKAGD